jgi:hypothetical protein
MALKIKLMSIKLFGTIQIHFKNQDHTHFLKVLQREILKLLKNLCKVILIMYMKEMKIGNLQFFMLLLKTKPKLLNFC